MAAILDVGAASQPLTCVAEYLRMSTDRQSFSIGHQAAATQRYAEDHAMRIVRRYVDEGKSGLDASGRNGFLELLIDVQRGDAVFTAVLVYDISRWGRFQDLDESAHYEYMCKRAGIRVIYCTESFENDGSPTAALLKNLRRYMDGEYSRVLSEKVFAAQSRLAAMGFFQGGPPGYGLRRQVVDVRGNRKQLLAPGERKGLLDDRVVLVKGPLREIRTIRWIYAAFTERLESEEAIAAALNVTGSLDHLGQPWSRQAVHRVLTNERYLGKNTFNRRSFKLRKSDTRNDPALWIHAEKLFTPLIEPAVFALAAARFARLKITDEQMLQKLRDLHARVGKLTGAVIDQQTDMPCSATYRVHFGKMHSAYQRAGISGGKQSGWVEENRLLRNERRSFADRLAQRMIASGAQIEHAEGSPTMRVNASWTLGVFLMRCRLRADGLRFWHLPDLRQREADVTVVVRMAPCNLVGKDFYLLPQTPIKTTWQLTADDSPTLEPYHCQSLEILRTLAWFGR
ncbi:recombinase family protein [Variovorax sp. RTB1]|uniref:recombinase family protein n=1 Tax=Variovorax sp. RTB1 TaxID=3048631 RepID=UPI002B22E390|nr:recombinase family protein [Variovorax sp. RTB1]